LNDSAITDRTMRTNSSSYFKPLGLVNPRRLRVLVNYKF